MSTKELVLGNSQWARLTALNAFNRFAEAEKMSTKQVCEFIAADATGDMLYIVLDKFAYYLAFKESSKATLLSKNSVASYFGNVKIHLLEMYPALNAVSSRRLQKIGSILDKYCAKRGIDFTQQAPPCTKRDLRVIATLMYKNAAVSKDYKDAALINLLWYLLGRASDTMCLLKSQVAVYPGGCLHINFKRLKSAACQGASLFHDLDNFATCPVHALAVATVMESSPSEFLLDHLPRDTQELQHIEASAIPLQELLDGRLQNPEGDPASNTLDNGGTKMVSVPGIHAYVNRVLQKWTKISDAQNSGLTNGLSSHSFRRGAAQNANGDSTISTPWILDRGGWSLTSVSKAFSYIVSTTHEDQRVGKVLAGWKTEAKPRLPSLGVFDSAVGHTIQQLQNLLFAHAFGFPEHLNLRDDVLDVFMAVIILHFHDVRKLAPHAPYISRVQRAIAQLSVSEDEVAAWAVAIHTNLLEADNKTTTTPSSPPRSSVESELLRKQTNLIEQQTQMISNLAAQIKTLHNRVAHLEGADNQTTRGVAVASCPVPRPAGNLASSNRRNSSAKSLSSLWYEWFNDMNAYETMNRRRYHEGVLSSPVKF